MHRPEWLSKFEFDKWWFDPDRYPPCEDPEYWCRQIEVRLLLQGALVNKPEPQGKGIFIALLNGDPLWPTVKRPSLVREANYEDALALTKALLQSHEVGKHRAAVEEHDSSYTSDSLHEWSEKRRKLWTRPLAEIIDFSKDRAYVVVDLSQDDTELKAQFAGLLAKRGAVRKPMIDFVGWYRGAVLRYFDLITWGDIVDCKLTDAQLGDLLWPQEDVDRPDRVRKVTKPLCEKVISTTMRDRLAQMIGRP